MLTNLTVKNLALFKDLSVDFEDGLNIMTGETGAGKSILIGSVMLALGGRYSSEVIRDGAQSAYVELTFTVNDDSIRRALYEIDETMDLSDGALVISRRLMDGRSVSRINGENISLKKLRAAASVLLDLYGQRDYQLLLDSEGQGNFLDAYAGAGLSQAKSETQEAFKELAAVNARIRSIGEDDGARAREADLLAYEVDEIEKAGLQEGEDEELESQYRRLVNAQQILEGLSRALGALKDAQPGASDLVARAVRELAGIREYDEAADAFYEQLVQIDELMSDAAREISSYAEEFDVSGAEIDRIGSRLDQINHLKNKYGGTIGEVLTELRKKRERLELLTGAGERLEILTAKREELKAVLSEKCALLSQGRRKFAALMEREVADCLTDLSFADNRFEIRVIPDQTVTADGYDEVVFFLGANPGEPVRELSKAASGGELSRVMLALKAVMAGRERGKTLIFDEIDAGISGRTAGAVAEKLSVIAKTHQVLCVTHLAQIAAMADYHYKIEKSVDTYGGRQETVTEVAFLDADGQIKELSRILGGTVATRASCENAKEMKKLAEQYKKKNSLRGL